MWNMPDICLKIFNEDRSKAALLVWSGLTHEPSLWRTKQRIKKISANV